MVHLSTYSIYFCCLSVYVFIPRLYMSLLLRLLALPYRTQLEFLYGLYVRYFVAIYAILVPIG